MKYCVYIIPLNNFDTLFAFTDISIVFYEILKNYGHDVIVDNSNKFHTDRRYIIFGAHLILDDTKLPNDCIIVNLEQLYDNQINKNYFNVLSSHEIWDYSRTNIDFLTKKGIHNVKYIDIGYSTSLEYTDFDFKPAKPLLLNSTNNKPNKEFNIFACYIINNIYDTDKLAHTVIECNKYNLSTIAVEKEEIALKMIAKRKDNMPSLIINDNIIFLHNFEKIKTINVDRIVYLGYVLDTNIDKIKTKNPFLFISVVSDYYAYLITPKIARRISSNTKLKNYIFEVNNSQVFDVLWNQKIYIYIHVAAVNNWIDILNDILHKLEINGLYNVVQEIRICYLGSDENLEKLKNIIQNKNKIKIRDTNTNLSIYERITLNALHKDSSDEHFKVLYIHTKGVTRKGSENVSDWINYLHHFVITKYQHCLDSLESFDTVGCNLRNSPKPHYNGNIWWSNSDYIKKLPYEIGRDYLDPEMWVLQGGGNFLSVFNSNINHYEQRYPEEKYINKDFMDIVFP